MTVVTFLLYKFFSAEQGVFVSYFFFDEPHVFFLCIFQVWDIQPYSCLWSFGRNIFSTHLRKLCLLYFLIHKSEAKIAEITNYLLPINLNEFSDLRYVC